MLLQTATRLAVLRDPFSPLGLRVKSRSATLSPLGDPFRYRGGYSSSERSTAVTRSLPSPREAKAPAASDGRGLCIRLVMPSPGLDGGTPWNPAIPTVNLSARKMSPRWRTANGERASCAVYSTRMVCRWLLADVIGLPATFRVSAPPQRVGTRHQLPVRAGENSFWSPDSSVLLEALRVDWNCSVQANLQSKYCIQTFHPFPGRQDSTLLRKVLPSDAE